MVVWNNKRTSKAGAIVVLFQLHTELQLCKDNPALIVCQKIAKFELYLVFQVLDQL